MIKRFRGIKKKGDMSEFLIQRTLYFYRMYKEIYPILVSNIYLFYWESDLIYISKSGYVTEYEIKISKSDFKADKKKEYKHQKLNSHDPFKPKYFWYVCPPNIIDAQDIPDYAGLIYCDSLAYDEVTYSSLRDNVKIIKEAPRLRSDKITDQKLLDILKKGNTKYWNTIIKQ